MADLLHVGELSFDPEQDLTFAEKRAVRLLVRTELWDEDVMGDFDWLQVPDEEVIAATVAVWMLRHEPEYTLEQAMNLRPGEVMRSDDPPTKRSPQRASGRSKASAGAGSQS